MRKILLATVAVLALALYGWSAIAEPAGNIPLFLGGKHKNLAANFIVATTAAVDQKIFIFRLLGRSDDLGNWDSQESANQIQR
jgi:hypothetical protein